MLQGFGDRHSFHWIFFEYLEQKVLCILTYRLPLSCPEIEILTQYALIDLFLGFSIEGRLATEKDVSHAARTPDVDLCIIFLMANDLRRHVHWTAKHLLHLILGLVKRRKPEISQLNIQVLNRVNKDILRLDISMHHIVFVHIVQGQE